MSRLPVKEEVNNRPRRWPPTYIEVPPLIITDHTVSSVDHCPNVGCEGQDDLVVGGDLTCCYVNGVDRRYEEEEEEVEEAGGGGYCNDAVYKDDDNNTEDISKLHSSVLLIESCNSEPTMTSLMTNIDLDSTSSFIEDCVTSSSAADIHVDVRYPGAKIESSPLSGTFKMNTAY